MTKPTNDLRDIDLKIIKIIRKHPGIAFKDLRAKFPDFSRIYITERTLNLQRQKDLIVRTKEREGAPTQYWPVGHPDIPVAWVVP
jgi:hypothetical protein